MSGTDPEEPTQPPPPSTPNWETYQQPSTPSYPQAPYGQQPYGQQPYGQQPYGGAASPYGPVLTPHPEANTAMIMGAQGICFSVAANTALHILTQILKHGRVRRSRIGIVAEQTPIPARLAYATGLTQGSGVRIREVETGSPAER